MAITRSCLVLLRNTTNKTPSRPKPRHPTPLLSSPLLLPFSWRVCRCSCCSVWTIPTSSVTWISLSRTASWSSYWSGERKTKRYRYCCKKEAFFTVITYPGERQVVVFFSSTELSRLLIVVLFEPPAAVVPWNLTSFRVRGSTRDFFRRVRYQHYIGCPSSPPFFWPTTGWGQCCIINYSVRLFGGRRRCACFVCSSFRCTINSVNKVLVRDLCQNCRCFLTVFDILEGWNMEFFFCLSCR